MRPGFSRLLPFHGGHRCSFVDGEPGWRAKCEVFVEAEAQLIAGTLFDGI